jgi:hypothetical protein
MLQRDRCAYHLCCSGGDAQLFEGILGAHWDKPFWDEIWSAVQRLLGATVILGFHAVYRLGLHRAFDRELGKVEQLLDLAESVAVVVITIQLLLETATIFVVTGWKRMLKSEPKDEPAK